MNNIQFGQPVQNPNIPTKPYQILGQGAVGAGSSSNLNSDVTAPSSAFASAINSALGQAINNTSVSGVNNAISNLGTGAQYTDLIDYINNYPLTSSVNSAASNYTNPTGTDTSVNLQTPTIPTSSNTGQTTSGGSVVYQGNGSFNNSSQGQAASNDQSTSDGSSTMGSNTGTTTNSFSNGSTLISGSGGGTTSTTSGTTMNNGTSTGTFNIPGVGDIPNTINGVPISYDPTIGTNTTTSTPTSNALPVDKTTGLITQDSLLATAQGIKNGTLPNTQLNSLESLYYNLTYGYAKGESAAMNPESGGSLTALATKIQTLLAQQNQ